MTHEHRLTGCRPTPLASYLKALGILRLVAEQADPDARGSWQRDAFVLKTQLTRTELEQFFRDHYAPTPLVGPWGGRSGFYPDNSEKSAREALDAIMATADHADTSARLARFRAAVTAVRGVLDTLGVHEKADVSDNKQRIMQSCRARLPDDLLDWLDACYVLTDEGSKFPPLFGTGGNEGSGSYMSGFAQQVVECVIDHKHDHDIATALWDQLSPDSGTDQTPGQFHPGAVDTKAQLSAWDYLLCLEGALLFAAALVRRNASARGVMAAPFTVRPVYAGYGSAAVESARAELWLPLWLPAMSLRELRHLLREARAELGRQPVRSGLDFARALSTMGVERGISEFQRFGILERNGLSYFAAPLDRIQVSYRPRVAQLGEINDWLDRFRHKASGDRAPAAAAQSLRGLDEAILALCRQGTPAHLRAVWLALGRCERMMATRPQFVQDAGLRPLPPLSHKWLLDSQAERSSQTGPAPSDAGSTELRLALALAGLYRTRPPRAGDKHSAAPTWLRENLEPVRIITRAQRQSAQWRDRADRNVVWRAGDLIGSLTAIFERRLLARQGIDTDKHDQGECGVLPASHHDIAAFLAGEVDESLLADLIWACALLDWGDLRTYVDKHKEHQLVPADDPAHGSPSAFYGLLKLCFSGHKITSAPIPLTSRIHRLATAGRGREASRAAIQRLRASGRVTKLDAIDTGGQLVRRTAAALVFPLLSESIDNICKNLLIQLPSPHSSSSPDQARSQGTLV